MLIPETLSIEQFVNADLIAQGLSPCAPMSSALEAGRIIYPWSANRRQAMVEAVWVKFGAFVHEQIIWVKDRPVLGRSWYSWQHEPGFLGWVRPHRPDRVADDFLSTVCQVPTVAPGQGPATGSILGRCASPAIFAQPILWIFGASDNRLLKQ